MTIQELFKPQLIELNKEENLPNEIFGSNQPNFSIIAFINIAISLLMSESYDHCEFLISKVQFICDKHPENIENPYVAQALGLLSEIKNKLIEENLISGKY